jgi:predicted RNA-binding Zn-ribbon protein involved in translation (DUF1610 family)
MGVQTKCPNCGSYNTGPKVGASVWLALIVILIGFSDFVARGADMGWGVVLMILGVIFLIVKAGEGINRLSNNSVGNYICQDCNYEFEEIL